MTRVKPLPDAIDVTALTDATVAGEAFDESAIEETDGKTYLTLQIYDYDRYDMVDISKLAEGSVIVAGGKDMTVSSVEQDGSLVLINGGLTRGGHDARNKRRRRVLRTRRERCEVLSGKGWGNAPALRQLYAHG